MIVGNQDTKHFHFSLPQEEVGVALLGATVLDKLPILGRGRLPMRFNKIDVASLCHSITRPLTAPVLRLVYESYIPGPTRPETEQPADEFVYEIE
jgi:hypothetical protein